MAIDISKGSHAVAFPSKVAAAAGSPHQWDIVLTANADNGTLCTRGDYVSHFNYKQAAAPSGFEGVIREQSANGNWYIEVTDADGALLLYNAPVSPYGEKELQDESLFYNAKDDVVRGYELIVGDWFEVSKEGFTGVPEAGKAVSYSSGKYVVAE